MEEWNEKWMKSKKKTVHLGGGEYIWCLAF